ncbi:MAG TPA: NADP-dependent oxidoreductase [Gaiellaceae bacterium]|nr:NADP-dependent oxidoreductase [Gaiellaceae bacterium]
MTPKENATIQAVRQTSDDPAGLEVTRIAAPVPGPDEKLVRVHAAAITRTELTWFPDRLPAIPSFEIAGVVEGTGEEVFALLPFDRDGGARELVATPASVLAPKPAALSYVEAAALPMPALTAWQALFDHGRLAPGERVLILGGAGGVGSVAVQLAKWHGAHVVATASTGNIEFVRSLGADEVIDHTTEDFTQIEPVAVVFDTAGGENLRRAPAVLATGGRLVSVAEDEPEGVYFIVEPNGAQLAEIGKLVDVGKVKPLVDATFPLADARAAFERSLAGSRRGKIVIEVTD